MDYNSSSTDYGDYSDYYQRSHAESYFDHRMATFITDALIWAICILSLPLNGAAIYATFSQVQKDVTRIYFINLLVSDLVQLCSTMAPMTIHYGSFISTYVYWSGLMVSVGFMVCIALERCSVIFCPQGSCFRSVKVCAVVCFFVWLVPLCFFISFTALGPVTPLLKAVAVFLLLPCPFLIATLGVSLKSLCAFDSVKHRAVGSVVLLALVHMLLISPFAIFILTDGTANQTLNYVLHVTYKLSPLADIFLYFFLTKRDTENNVSNSVNRPVMNHESSHINSSV